MNTTMEPRIQYARTSDAVSIAYCVAGEGPELLFVSPPPLCRHVAYKALRPRLSRVSSLTSLTETLQRRLSVYADFN